ncbi:MAG: diguanylate cyclase [Lachnospiraceae bacterium]|jgi:diguanylate cyclase (GGDEF)-like protein|nr:diguanylate cyclase [Lachnospiraceae bacterium]
MERVQDMSKKDCKLTTKKLPVLGVISFFTFFFIIFSFTDFSRRLIDKETENYRRQLKELSEKSASLIENKVNSSSALLKSTMYFVDSDISFHSEDVMETLEHTAREGTFHVVGIADQEGRAWLTDGTEINVGKEDYFQVAIKGEMYISDVILSRDGTTNYFVIANPFTHNDMVLGVIFGMFDVDNLGKLLMPTEETDDRYVHVVEPQGRFIVRSTNPRNIFVQDNLWDALDKMVFEEGNSKKEIWKAMENRESGFTSYHQGEEERIAYYTPLGINNWYIFSTTRKDGVYRDAAISRELVLILTGRILLVFLWILFLVIIFSYLIRKKILLNNKELKASAESFRIAVSKTQDVIFDYYLDKDEIIFRNKGHGWWGLYNIMKNIPESFISGGKVSEETSGEIRKTFKEIREGKESSSCIFCSHSKGNLWEKMTLTNIFDDSGKVMHSVGVIEDITVQKEQEEQARQGQEYQKIFLAHLMYSCSLNLTRDIFSTDKEGDVRQNKSYDEVLKDFLTSSVYEEDKEKVEAALSRKSLLQRYENGEDEITVELRRTDGEKGVYWTEYRLHLAKESDSSDVRAIVLVKNIDYQKRRELSLQYKAQIDALTQLYNRETTESFIDAFLAGQKKNGLIQAFMILDLDNFKQINDIFGHAQGDFVLTDVASKIRGNFRKTDVLGRLGGDEFIILMKDVDSIDDVGISARELVKVIKHTYEEGGQKVTISASVGIAIFPIHGKDFKTLYKKADAALYSVKRNTKNGYAIYTGTKEDEGA